MLRMADEHFFQTRCVGTLNRDDRTVSVTFSVTCSREGDVAIVFDDLPLTKETLWVRESLDGAALRLEALDESGRRVSSHTVYLDTAGTRSNETGDWITCSGIAVWIEVADAAFDPAAPADGVVASYYPIGLRGFGVQKISTRAGALALLANATVKNFDQITGRFDITAAASTASIIEWLSVADDVAYDLLDILSFAEGRFIQWSVRRLSRDGHVIVTEFHGPGRTGRPRHGFYHWLDLQPVLELSLKYTPELKARTGIDVALEWSLMNPRYLELDFVACMTALEHLTDVFEEGGGKVDPPGRAFFKSTIAPALKSILETTRTSAAAPEDLDAIEKALGKINDLNRLTLQDSISLMLQAYSVPTSGLEGCVSDLIKLRNDIVHRGVARKASQPKLQHQVNVVRELLTRTFLKLLGYKGKYHSYLSGRQEFIPFPDA
jgi:hypothetical protein